MKSVVRLLLCLGILLHRVRGQASVTRAGYEPSNVGGTTPTAWSLLGNLGTGINASGDTMVVTANTAIFAGNAAPSFQLYDSSYSQLMGITWNNASTDANGEILTLELVNGTVPAGDFYMTVSSDLANVPSAGTVVQLTLETTGDTISSATNALRTIASPTIALTSVNMNSGTVPTQLQVSFTLPFDVGTGDSIELVASRSVLVSAQTSGLTLSGIGSSSYSTSSAATLAIVLSGSFALGTSVVMTINGPMLAALPSVSDVVTMTVNFISLAGVTLPVFADATGFGSILHTAVAGNDPIAKFGSTVRVYELPPHVLTPLVIAPDITLHGSVFEGSGPWEQWFNRIVFTPVEQDRFLEIQIKPDLHQANFSQSPLDAFKTFDITVGVGKVSKPESLFKVPGFQQKVPRSFMGYEIVFRRLMRHHSSSFTSVGKVPRECVDIAGAWFHVYVCSTAAMEYYGHLRDLSVKYTHLDMMFVEVKSFDSLTGLLPELWGVHPMSEATKACVKS